MNDESMSEEMFRGKITPEKLTTAINSVLAKHGLTGIVFSCRYGDDYTDAGEEKRCFVRLSPEEAP